MRIGFRFMVDGLEPLGPGIRSSVVWILEHSFLLGIPRPPLRDPSFSAPPIVSISMYVGSFPGDPQYWAGRTHSYQSFSFNEIQISRARGTVEGGI